MIIRNGFKPSFRSINILNAGFGSMLISRHIPLDTELLPGCSMILCRGLLFPFFSEMPHAANISNINNYYYNVKADNYFFNKTLTLSVTEANRALKRDYGEQAFLGAGRLPNCSWSADGKKKSNFCGEFSYSDLKIAENRKQNNSVEITRNARKTDAGHRTVYSSAALNAQNSRTLHKILIRPAVQAAPPLQFVDTMQTFQSALSRLGISKMDEPHFNIPANCGAGFRSALRDTSKGSGFRSVLRDTSKGSGFRSVLRNTSKGSGFRSALRDTSKGSGFRSALRDTARIVTTAAPSAHKSYVTQTAYVMQKVYIGVYTRDTWNVHEPSNAFEAISGVSPALGHRTRAAHDILGTEIGNNMIVLYTPKGHRRFCSRLERCLHIFTLKQSHMLKTERSYASMLKTIKRYGIFTHTAGRQFCLIVRRQSDIPLPLTYKYLLRYFGAETISLRNIQKALSSMERGSVSKLQYIRKANAEYTAELEQNRRDAYKPRASHMSHSFYGAAIPGHSIRSLYKTHAAHAVHFAYSDTFMRRERFAPETLIAYRHSFTPMHSRTPLDSSKTIKRRNAYIAIPLFTCNSIFKKSGIARGFRFLDLINIKRNRYMPHFVFADGFALSIQNARALIVMHKPNSGGAGGFKRSFTSVPRSAGINPTHRARQLASFKVKAIKKYYDFVHAAEMKFFLPSHRNRVIRLPIFKYLFQYSDTEAISPAGAPRVAVYAKTESAYIFDLTAASFYTLLRKKGISPQAELVTRNLSALGIVSSKGGFKTAGGLLQILHEKRYKITYVKQIQKLGATARPASNPDYRKQITALEGEEPERPQMRSETAYKFFRQPLLGHGKNETSFAFNRKISRSSRKKLWSNYYLQYMYLPAAVIENLNTEVAVFSDLRVTAALGAKETYARAEKLLGSLDRSGVYRQMGEKGEKPSKRPRYNFKKLSRRITSDKLITNRAAEKQTAGEYSLIGLHYVNHREAAWLHETINADTSFIHHTEGYMKAAPFSANHAKSGQARSLYKHIISTRTNCIIASLASEKILAVTEKLYGIPWAEKTVSVEIGKRIALTDYLQGEAVTHEALVNKRADGAEAKKPDTSTVVSGDNGAREYVYSAPAREKDTAYADTKDYGSAAPLAAGHESILRNLEIRLNEVSNAVNTVNVNYIYESVYEKIERRLRNERRRYGM